LLQRLRRLEGNHHAHQKREQRHYGQGIDSGYLKDAPDFFPVHAPRTKQTLYHCQRDFSDEFDLLAKVT